MRSATRSAKHIEGFDAVYAPPETSSFDIVNVAVPPPGVLQSWRVRYSGS
jgi:hypothetical protein